MLSPLLMLAAVPRLAAMPIYNDTDDRQYTEDVSDPALLSMANATVALVLSKNVSPKGFLTGEPQRELCEGEAYIDELRISFCSGVLIAPDVIATAAHCLQGTDPKDIRAVFGYTQREDYPSVKPDQLYTVSVLGAGTAHSLSGDIAILRLDRPAQGRKPLKISAKAPATGDRVMTAGHPNGMPQMLQGNGAITRVSTNAAFFVTDLDNNWGQSGSPVLDASGRLIGLMQGNLAPKEPNTTSDLYLDTEAGCYRHRRVAAKPMKISEKDIPAADLADLKSISASSGGKLDVPVGSAVVCIAPFMKRFEEQAKPLSVPSGTAKAKASSRLKPDFN